MKEGEISHSAVRNWYFGLRVFQLLYNVIVIVVLIWLRLDWGITNWVYTAQFTNFWSGIYIFFAGSCIGTVESIVGFCALINLSIRLIIVDQVSGLTSLLLQLVGLTCMLTDSLGKPVGWIQDLIRDLIDPAQMNNIMATENFLHNLYRIVECCGARGPDDYLMYDRSPPNACIDRYHAGGIFFKQGCGVGFSTYLKEWSAGLGATVLVGLIVQASNVSKARKTLGLK
ncbi:tetraspanin-2A [Eurytemora carolleeae]|uniref:tetraspanin-2A n=1 Tax=Eurytemora carolleeae TaxID=1294199 RepID=UPI000C785DF5|nr:tetraspanin-2A [Eurytemora carolleeae]|eukprot:XP_023338183.1 tetraspanin-2A-like [Eurytemora affinis]